jgi:hypothetical protein
MRPYKIDSNGYVECDGYCFSPEKFNEYCLEQERLEDYWRKERQIQEELRELELEELLSR